MPGLSPIEEIDGASRERQPPSDSESADSGANDGDLRPVA
jgi:hypothetical protein